MTKTFGSLPEPRETRRIATPAIETRAANDPAFQAAAAIFGPEARKGGAEEREIVAPDRAPAAPVGSVAAPSGTVPSVAVSIVAPPERSTRVLSAVPGLGAARPAKSAVPAAVQVSIYVDAATAKRLNMFRYDQEIAASIVVEYALERLLATESDGDIAAVLRSRGHGKRKARPIRGTSVV